VGKNIFSKSDAAVTGITEGWGAFGEYSDIPGAEDGFHPKFPENR
jgi:hypothetical protein